MPLVFDPQTGEVREDVPEKATIGGGPPKRRPTKPTGGKTYKIDLNPKLDLDEIAKQNPELINKKFSTPLPSPNSQQVEAARAKKLKAEQDVEAAKLKDQRRQQLAKKYQSRLPKNEAERKELLEFVGLQADYVGMPRQTFGEDLTKLSQQAVGRLRNEKNEEILRQNAEAEVGRSLSTGDRFLGNIAQGIDEVATGVYAIPKTVFMQTQERDKELATEFLGEYGRSVSTLIEENKKRRGELQALPENATSGEKAVSILGETAGQLLPTIGLASTGIGVPIAAAIQGVTSSIGTGQEEEAFQQGVFGALGAGAGMATEQAAINFAANTFSKNTLLDGLRRQLLGRTATASAGAIVNQFQNEITKAPKDAARVNLLTGAVLDALFYGGPAKGGSIKVKGMPAPEKVASYFEEPISSPKIGTLATAGARASAGEIKEPIKWYYSQLEKVVQDKFPNKVSPAQAATMLKDPKYGIKAEEYGYSGLDKLIAAKAADNTPITKAEILDTLNANRLEVKEVVLGGQNTSAAYNPQYSAFKALKGGKDTDYKELLLQLPEKILPDSPYEAARKEFFIEEVANPLGPNNPNWHAVFDRETGMQLSPASTTRLEAETELDRIINMRTRDLQINLGVSQLDTANYIAPHFGKHKNIIAHARFDEGKGPNGERQLRIQEIQSDWHQQGREKGYRSDPEALELINQRTQKEEELNRTGFAGKSQEEIDNLSDNDFLNINVRNAQLIDEINALKAKENKLLPDAPFKNTWHELAFKRMVRWAAENGYDEIVWTQGKQQIDLYQSNLRQNVDKIEVVPSPGYDDKYDLIAYKGGNQVFTKTGQDTNTIKELVGPTIATKLLSKEQETTALRKQLADIRSQTAELASNIQDKYGDNWNVRGDIKDDPLLAQHSALIKDRYKLRDEIEKIGRSEVAGEDLSIGGQVHKLLYDQKLPQFAQKLAKKYGAEYKKTTTQSSEGRFPLNILEDGSYDVETMDGDYVGQFYSYEEAVEGFINGQDPNLTLTKNEAIDKWEATYSDGNRYELQDGGFAVADSKDELLGLLLRDMTKGSEQAKYAEVHSLTISPELRDSVMKTGQPAFQKAPAKPFGSGTLSKQEVGIHEQWGVPKWDPKIQGGKYIDHIDEARWTAIKTPQGPTIYSNASGLGVLDALIDMQNAAVKADILETGDLEFASIREGVTGLRNITQGWAMPTLPLKRFLWDIDQIRDPEFQPLIDDLKTQLVKAIKLADDEGSAAVVVVSLDRPTKAEVIETLRHEEIHRTQMSIEQRLRDETNMAWDLFDLGWFKTVPNYDKIAEGLQMRGAYDVSDVGTVAREALAHIGAGQYDVIGLSVEQAAKSFSTMLRYVADNYGISEVKKFAFDPGWRGVINDVARSAEEFRQQVESSTKSGKSGGSLFDRIREWWRGGGESKPTGVSGGISGPAFQRQPWDNVDTGFEPPKWRDRLRKKFQSDGMPGSMDFMDRLSYELTDAMTPILKAWSYLEKNRSFLPSENANYLMRLWLGVGGKVQRIFDRGMIDGNNKIVTPGGVSWLLEPWKGLSKTQFFDESAAALQLMISERTLELATVKAVRPDSTINLTEALTGIAGDVKPGNPFTNDIAEAVHKIKEVYNSADPDRIARIEEASKRYREWSEKVLDYAHEKGLMRTTKYNELKREGKFYVDLHKIFDDNEDAILDSTPTKYGAVKKMFRRLSGSSATISNPYLNLMIATDQVIREADRNYAVNAFVTPIRDLIMGQNLSPQQQAELDSIAIKHNNATRDTIKVFRNGVMEHWEFSDDITAAMKGWGDFKSNIIVDTITFPLNLLRLAITRTPGFLVRNLLRDAQQRTLVSKTTDNIKDILNPMAGSKPWDIATQIFKPLSLKDRDAFWMTGASQAGHYLSSRVDYQSRLWSGIKDLTKDGKTILYPAQAGLKFLFKDLPEISENVNRYAEYEAAYKKGKAQGLTDYDAEIKAAFESRDLMDFAVAGRSAKFLNKFIIFLNPAIQGLRKEIGAATEKGIKGATPFIVKWGIYSLIPSMMEYAFNVQQGEDTLEEWRQMPAWRKDLMYNLKIGPDRWISIPKPFTMGVASSITNRLIDYVKGNKNAFEGAAGSLAKSLIPVDEAALAGPGRALLEAWANYDWFYDEHIVSPYEERRDPMFFRNRGTVLGRSIGSIMDRDPRIVDHMLRSVGGDWGLMAGYIGELINLQFVSDDPKAKSDIAWRLAKLSSGNFVRSSKPDQASDVKHVIKEAFALKGEKSDWYQSLDESINAYRDANTPEDRQGAALEALYRAKIIRQNLPEFRQLVTQNEIRLDLFLKGKQSFQKLDKRQQSMVKSNLESQLLKLSNDYMTAKVSGSNINVLNARLAQREFNLNAEFLNALLEAKQKTFQKKVEERVTPTIPRRPAR